MLVSKHFSTLVNVYRTACILVADTASPIDRPVPVASLNGVGVAIAGNKFSLSPLSANVDDFEGNFSLGNPFDPNGAVNNGSRKQRKYHLI